MAGWLTNRSFKANKIFPSEYPNTIADGLRTQLGELTFEVIKKYVDEIILVSEQEIVDAMRLLWERLKLVVEPSGAVSLAGVLKKSKAISGLNVGVMISGGNIDLTEFFDMYSKQIK